VSDPPHRRDVFEVENERRAAAAEQAEYAAVEAENDAREARARAQREAAARKQPQQKRHVSALEKRRLAHNAAMAKDVVALARRRRAFVQSHAEVLRPFVPGKILEKNAAAVIQDQQDEAGGEDISSSSSSAAASQCLAGGDRHRVIQPQITETPQWLRAELRDYQLEGLTWLLQTYRDGISPILADEMGLGKTLQTIAFLSTLKYELKADGPFLIVAPLSVLSSWMTEFRRWCPTLRVLKLHSTDPKERDRMRQQIVPDVGSYDCIVTTFEMSKSSKFHNSLRRIAFRYLVIDEGHMIKNETTCVAQALRKLNFASALLLTGTPLQNNMHELWALLNFLLPDVFTDCVAFDSAFNLAKSEVNDSMLGKAHYMLRPFLLRRIKEDVEKSVPPKEEIKVFCPLRCVPRARVCLSRSACCPIYSAFPLQRVCLRQVHCPQRTTTILLQGAVDEGDQPLAECSSSGTAQPDPKQEAIQRAQ
jgi:SWI/SNF-related matrix-associated actin-dependent regulator of chromatin subfamily A member 5